jgi:hypothetical protein
VGGARGEVGGDSLTQGRHGAPGDDGVDESIAPAAREVRIGESQRAEQLCVVRIREVGRHVLPGGRPRPHSVGFQQHGLFRAEPLARSDDLPHLRGLLGRREVREHAGSLLRGQPDHLREERSEHDWRLLARCGGHVRRRLHPGEVRLHELDRALVAHATALVGRGIADAQPENEPIGKELAQPPRRIAGRDGLAAVGDRDAAANHERPRLVEQVSGQ